MGGHPWQGEPLNAAFLQAAAGRGQEGPGLWNPSFLLPRAGVGGGPAPGRRQTDSP